jgi:methyl-coenzyme M reductase subunit D
VIAVVQELCDEFFTRFPYTLQKGRFMKSSPTLVDYAKYGPKANELVIGLVDPRKRDSPIIIPIPAGTKHGEDCQDISRENIHQI